MRSVLAIAGRELRAAFESPVAYAVIGIFVVASAALFFLVGLPVGRVPLPSLWEGGEANLIVLFAWLPLSLGVLVPALCMNSWTEERRAGTEELFLTYPVRVGQIVLGKFVAHTSLVALLLLLLVLPVAVTVGRLGDLDWSTVWVGLAGAALLGAAYVALALWISALASDPLVAFLTGSLALLALWLLRLVVEVFPAGLAGALDALTPAARFLGSAARGVVDPRDALYFLTLVLAGLYLNAAVVERRREA